MSEITEYLSGYLKELDSYMKRLNRDGLSRKDRKLFFEISNEYYDIFRKSEEFPEELLQGISEFSDNIMNQQPDESKELAGRYQDNIVQRANDYIDATLRNELQFGIFRKDAEILNLQNEKIQMMQELADMDLKMYGKITEQTQDILDVQNCEMLNGRVREIALWERADSVPEIAAYQDEADMQDKGRKEEVPMEKRRVISKDEMDQILSSHFRECQSGRGVKILDLSNCIISNYVFKGDLSAVSFDNSDLRYCEFRMTRAEHVSLQNAILSKCNMTQAEFNQCSFNNADISATMVRNSMFRECSFDTAYMKQSSIQDSVFYRTSFADTRMRELLRSENIFHECGHSENTVRPESAADVDRESAADYVGSLREMFNNEGYMYSWELNGIDMEAYVADLSIKISHDGETIGVEKYSALLDPETYVISHIDTGRQGDSLIRMFMPEMNKVITENMQERIREQEQQRVRLKFPYMTRDTFMDVKDEIKRMGAEFDPERKGWYVSQSAGKEAINDIRDYISGHDEAVYLKLPSAEPQEFKRMIEQLKQDGARYNSDKKLWFITEGADQSKFRQYLPAGKDSVHEKLNGYKSEADKQRIDSHEMESRRKEMPERA